MRIYRFIPLLGLATLLSMADAQDQEVTLRFLAFPKQLRPEPVELVVGKGKTIEVQTPGNELSQPYKVPALPSIIVGKTIEQEEGEPTFDVYGKGKAIGASEQIVLLIRRGKQNSDGFVVLPLNGELGRFKGGSFLFINASKIDVAGVIGDLKFTLKPSKRTLLKPKPNHPGKVCQATFAYRREDEWKRFKDTRWSANERYRSLVFFHQDPNSGRLGVSPVVDVLPYNP